MTLLTEVETARRLGVSTEYLRKRLRECGIAKRPGGFRSKVAYAPPSVSTSRETLDLLE